MKKPKTRKELRRVIKSLEEKQRVSPETKKSVTAILLLGLSVILILASIGLAGPAGTAIYHGLFFLFGWGYFLIPKAAAGVALLFIFTREKNFFGITFLGAALAVLSSLGLIDIISPEKGGFVGKLVGTLEVPFGKIAGLVVLGTLLITSILIAFDFSIQWKPRGPKKKDEEASASREETLPEVAEPEAAEEEQEPEEEKEEPVEPVIAKTTQGGAMLTKIPVAAKDYVSPPLSLLKSSIEKPTSGDLRANANIIKRTLESFGIPVEMGEISIGPKVTRYTLKPAEGVKLTKITALNQDLALALAAHPIRIEAPIPGKSLVGIEVPNKAAAIVRLGSLLGFEDFAKLGSLGFPLGRDVSGEPIFIDIEKMPHLLVAGSTGSGKSIMIHSILISLLYKNSPQSLRLILIDPKRVELSIYEGIPHLAAPVITDAKKALGVFRWSISEMEHRYETLLSAGSRDIKSYNKNHKDEPLPYLVLVVDEMADLMARYGREVEGSIVRLAQMARATGIHLILSTQRPSVEVVTGLIKANITARIALQVASQIDSRTILDSAGAEKLLGGGDLLFISSEFSKPKRVQGAYLGEEETRSVIEFIIDHNESVADAAPAIAAANNGVASEGRDVNFDDYMGSDEDDDDLYREAVETVQQAGKASASLLQRRLKVGYARAARLLDLMEERGVIGPGDGAKPREILLDENTSHE